MLLTYNSKPIALILPIDGDEDVFSLLNLLGRYQVLNSVVKLQVELVKKGYTKITMEEINKEIGRIREKLIV